MRGEEIDFAFKMKGIFSKLAIVIYLIEKNIRKK